MKPKARIFEPVRNRDRLTGRRHKSWAKVTAPRPGDKLHNNNTINKTNRRNRNGTCCNRWGHSGNSIALKIYPK
ncbi:hypothetical protein J6590_100536, partial [Homalodisca vitripennis]